MNTIGEFTGHSILAEHGVKTANNILKKVKTGEITIHDDYFKQFLCCIFAEGNFEFLRVLAENWYVDTRKDVILDFIDNVEKTTLEGKEELHRQVNEKKREVLCEILKEL